MAALYWRVYIEHFYKNSAGWGGVQELEMMAAPIYVKMVSHLQVHSIRVNSVKMLHLMESLTQLRVGYPLTETQLATNGSATTLTNLSQSRRLKCGVFHLD